MEPDQNSLKHPENHTRQQLFILRQCPRPQKASQQPIEGQKQLKKKPKPSFVPQIGNDARPRAAFKTLHPLLETGAGSPFAANYLLRAFKTLHPLLETGAGSPFAANYLLLSRGDFRPPVAHLSCNRRHGLP